MPNSMGLYRRFIKIHKKEDNTQLNDMYTTMFTYHR